MALAIYVKTLISYTEIQKFGVNAAFLINTFILQRCIKSTTVKKFTLLHYYTCLKDHVTLKTAENSVL